MTSRVDATFTAHMARPHEWEKMFGSRVSALAELRTFLRGHVERIGGGVTVSDIEVAPINGPGWDDDYRVTFTARMDRPGEWAELFSTAEEADTELQRYVTGHIERIGGGVEITDPATALVRG